MVLKNFVVFEGIDGAGTSTQIAALKASEHSERFDFSAEPTGGETGKFLRKMLGGEIELDPRTATYLFAADRAEHIWGKGGVQEKCGQGKICVSDRYFFSSLAYQTVSCGKELPSLLNSPFPLPELLFFFKIPPAVSLSRIENRGKREIYEKIEYLEKTEALYESIISDFEKNHPEMKTVRIDATKGADEITKIILLNIDDKLK